MKTQVFSSLGLDISLRVPETVEEFNENAKRTDGKNACLEEAINNIVYRGCLAEFRDIFLHGRKEVKEGDRVIVPAIKGVDAITGIDRLTKVTTLKGKDKDGNAETREDWDESEAKYFSRVLSTTGKKAEDFQPLANEVAAALEFDASAPERKAVGPRKLPKTYEEAAASIIQQGGFRTAVAKIAAVLGRSIEESGDKEKDIAALGWLIKEWKDVENKKLAAQLLS